MRINPFKKKAAPHVTVIGSDYGFVKTCVRVANTSTPAGALCEVALVCTVAGCVMGNPNFLVGALKCGKSIIDS